MAELITDEIVLVAARAGHAWDCPDDECDGSDVGSYEHQARDMLEAAAPLIAARVLEEAAEFIHERSDRAVTINADFISRWLQRTADEVRKEGRG